HDRFADFFHYAADGTTGLVRAGAFFIELFANATDRRQRSFDVANDRRKSNLLGSTRQAVTPGHAPFALYQSRGFEIVEYLFQEALGDVLLIGDSLNAHQRLVVIQA